MATCWHNFHLGTHGVFTPCSPPDRKPDYVSESGSVYWDEGDRVVREADHWGAVGECMWTFAGDRRPRQRVAGACAYGRFGSIVMITVERDRRVGLYSGLMSDIAGATISAIRTVRDRSGRVIERARRVIRVARETPCTIVTERGERLGKATLAHAWRVA